MPDLKAVIKFDEGQLRRLDKIFKKGGTGTGAGSAAATGGGLKGLAAGIRSGVFGTPAGKGVATKIGGMLGKLGLVSGTLMVVAKLVKGVLNVLAKASPMLQVQFERMRIAFGLFLKPMGDAIGRWLEPMAKAMLKASITWAKMGDLSELAKLIGDTISEAVGTISEKGAAIRGGGEPTEGDGFNLSTWVSETLKGWATTVFNFGSWIRENAGELIVGFFNIGSWFIQNIGEIVTGFIDFGGWLTENLRKYIENPLDIGAWLGTHLILFFKEVFAFGAWIKENIMNYISDKAFNFGHWLGANLRSFIIGTLKIGEWLKEKFIGFISGEFNVKDWLQENFIDFITGKFDIGSWLKGVIMDMMGGFLAGLTGEPALVSAASATTEEETEEPTPPVTGGGDFIVTKHGKTIRTDPQDNIFAGKGGMGGGGTVTITNEFNIQTGPIMNDMDLDALGEALAGKTKEAMTRRINYGLI